MINISLILDAAQREALAALRRRTETLPVGLEERVARDTTEAGKIAFRQRILAQSVSLPRQHTVAFWTEAGGEQGTLRHLAVGIAGGGRLPTMEAVWEIALQLGFVGTPRNCRAWFEDSVHHGQCLRLAQPFEADDAIKFFGIVTTSSYPARAPSTAIGHLLDGRLTAGASSVESPREGESRSRILDSMHPVQRATVERMIREAPNFLRVGYGSPSDGIAVRTGINGVPVSGRDDAQ